MNKDIVKTKFSQLPPWDQVKITELGVADTESWIQRQIPALGGRSVIETLQANDGENVLRGYFAKVGGRF